MGCRRFLVSGRVQGVFFRASTARKARALGLTGRAENLDDGRVAVVACGSDEAVAALEAWLWEGSPASKVTDVVGEDVDDASPAAFTTR